MLLPTVALVIGMAYIATFNFVILFIRVMVRSGIRQRHDANWRRIMWLFVGCTAMLFGCIATGYVTNTQLDTFLWDYLLGCLIGGVTTMLLLPKFPLDQYLFKIPPAQDG